MLASIDVEGSCRGATRESAATPIMVGTSAFAANEPEGGRRGRPPASPRRLKPLRGRHPSLLTQASCPHSSGRRMSREFGRRSPSTACVAPTPCVRATSLGQHATLLQRVQHANSSVTFLRCTLLQSQRGRISVGTVLTRQLSPRSGEDHL